MSRKSLVDKFEFCESEMRRGRKWYVVGGYSIIYSARNKPPDRRNTDIRKHDLYGSEEK